MEKQTSLLVEGRNCWRKARASRGAFLIDGEAYFSALAEALRLTRRSILIAGWDIHSQVALVREDEDELNSTRLASFLDEVVSRSPELQAHILAWDFAMLYALDREPLPIFRLGWKTHRRVHFYLDGHHPVGASHHQKMVVLDDRVAFVGGLDLTKERWDTPEHAPHDPRRLDPQGRPYPPFHDVQMMVEGDVARLLGELFRQRWRRATGKVITPPEEGLGEPWPPGVGPDLTDVEVAVARTEPAFRGRPEIREVEALYLDAISSARRYVYVENQYLSSSSIGEALAESLRKEEGPEVVLVLRRRGSGWLEESVMDGLRARLLRRLGEADRHGRLGVYYPAAPGAGGFINVHAKVLVVDDELVRVGSSNLSNRSMGLDTECDLAVEAAGQERTRRAIAGLRSRLLAEHLKTTPERVGELIEAKGSLIEAVEALRGPGETLRPFEDERPEDYLLSRSEILDPERPIRLERLIERFVSEEEREAGKAAPGRVKFLALALAMVGLAAAWRWTPLAEWVDVQSVARWAELIRGHPAAPVLVVAAYMVGGLVVFPVTVLIGATALVFQPPASLVYALVGSLASALLTYTIGRKLGRETVRRVAGERLNRLSRRIARRGVASVATVRIIPVAPYSIVNVVAGASHIRFRDFLVGTVLGLAPGILAITLLADRLVELIREPRWESLALLLAVAGMALGGFLGIRRLLSRDRKAAP